MITPQSHSTAPSRFFALDAARGFAVVAMVIAHTSPFIQPAPKVVVLAESILNDVAAPLFALLIGVTVVVAGAPLNAAPADRRCYRIQSARRAGTLIALGVLLDIRFSGVVIVLQHLGVTMLLMLPFVFLRTRTVLVCATGLLLVAPGIVTWCRLHLGLYAPQVYTTWFVREPVGWLVLDRSYQAITLLPLMLIGIAIGRTVMHSRQAMISVLIVAVPVFLVGRLWATFDLPGSDIRGSYPEVWREAALALGAFATIMLLVELASERLLRASGPIAEPFAVQGRMALSLYVFHVLILMGVYSVRSRAGESLLFRLCRISDDNTFQLLDVDVLRRQPAAQHIVGRRHRLDTQPTQISM